MNSFHNRLYLKVSLNAMLKNKQSAIGTFFNTYMIYFESDSSYYTYLCLVDSEKNKRIFSYKCIFFRIRLSIYIYNVHIRAVL